ncbi:hypothetical protein DNTS_033345 [Danionella cerebrum]|uniref:Uncharacterized protein n=1 Tax=Danionella cerebrum TaxID=2873325 RepID=A0A553QKB6_9TELE|nr:hypothetical protein DNTS_033345 [Danionella translucida]
MGMELISFYFLLEALSVSKSKENTAPLSYRISRVPLPSLSMFRKKPQHLVYKHLYIVPLQTHV